MLKHISLFSGIGGFDLACEWAGIETIVQVEIDPFCQKVLKKHWPNVKLVEDIHDFDGTKYRGTVKLVSAGPPCQPISCCGKRRGKADDRWLWQETFRVLSEVNPTWALFENPTGILTMGIDDLLDELEKKGYATESLVIPACSVNVPHRRDRIWIIAHTNSHGCNDRGALEQGRQDKSAKVRTTEENQPQWQGWFSELGKAYKTDVAWSK